MSASRDVAHQVGEERHRPGDDEHHALQHRGDCEHAEADRDRLHSGAGADDRRVDQTVGVPVLGGILVVVVRVVVVGRVATARPHREGEVTVRAVVVVLVLPRPVPVGQRSVHASATLRRPRA